MTIRDYARKHYKLARDHGLGAAVGSATNEAVAKVALRPYVSARQRHVRRLSAGSIAHHSRRLCGGGPYISRTGDETAGELLKTRNSNEQRRPAGVRNQPG